jgi:hypothetical protein
MKPVQFAFGTILRLVTKFGSSILIAAQLWTVMPVHASSPARDSVTTHLSGPISGFEEPLVPVAPTSREENEALLNAIQAYESRSKVDDLRAFDVFLSAYPHSGWRVAVLTNLGLAYYHYGAPANKALPSTPAPSIRCGKCRHTASG